MKTHPEISVAENAYLGGALTLRQPTDGFRSGAEAALLAAAAIATPAEQWLDVGAGVGSAALCLAKRVGAPTAALELDPALAQLARENAALNRLQVLVEVLEGDLFKPPAEVAAGIYHGVITNPPFFEGRHQGRPPRMAKAAARRADQITIADWIAACLKALRPRGRLVMIHRAERIDDIIAALHGKAGDLRIAPLWPKAGRLARMAIVSAVKDARGPAEIAPGLVLHQSVEGERAPYTAAAEAVLRDGAAFPWDDGACSV